MALPIAVQSLIGSSLNLVDNLMVIRLGEAELAAVGVAIQMFFIHWMVLYGFTSGSATFIAQFWGVRDIKNIRKTMGFAFFVCFSVSVLFFIAGMFFTAQVIGFFTNIPEIAELGVVFLKIGSWTFLLLSLTVPLTSALRVTQQTHIPMYASAIALATNTFLNYILIFGNFGAPKLGIAGAALGTVIARTLEMLILVIVVFGRKNIISGKLRDFFGWSKEFAFRIVNNAIPTTINESMWGFGMSLYVAAYARVGTIEYAAVQASSVIHNLFIMAIFSIGDATLILVGQKLGQGKLDEGYMLAKRLLKIGTVIGVSAGLLLILCAKPLVGFFDFTPEGARYAFLILIVNGLSMGLALFNGLNITGVLRAGGDTKFAMLSEVSCVWLFGVPLAFMATMWWHLPIYIAVLLVKSEEVVKFFILIKRFVSKKWVKNVIHGLEEQN